MAKKRKQGTLQNYVAPKEAAERLGVTTQTLRNWARKGKISFITLPSGRRHYDVDGLMAAMGAPAPAEPEVALQPSPLVPTMPAVGPAADQVMAALAKLMEDPRLAAHIASMVQGAQQRVAVAPTESAPMDLKSQIEMLADRV